MTKERSVKTTVSPPNRRSSLCSGAFFLSAVAIVVIAVVVVVDRDPRAPIEWLCKQSTYNNTYPETAPVTIGDEVFMKIAVVADLDKDSKHEHGSWKSYLLQGHLIRHVSKGTYRVEWEKDTILLQSYFSEKGRGLELSELQVFNGKLYTVDDRTGIVYEIVDDEAIPRHILTDGDGSHAKGFKAEWMAVKDEQLWIGGMGKEWTTPQGEIVNLNPQWVKVITADGQVKHYNALRSALDMPSPGYVLHESATWSDQHQRWFFLPRRASKEKYDEVEDEKRGVNYLLKADAAFSSVEILEAGPLNPHHGFSSFKFVPGTLDHDIVALKTMELDGVIQTFVTVFDLAGKVLLDISLIGEYKYEGLEFI